MDLYHAEARQRVAGVPPRCSDCRAEAQRVRVQQGRTLLFGQVVRKTLLPWNFAIVM